MLVVVVLVVISGAHRTRAVENSSWANSSEWSECYEVSCGVAYNSSSPLILCSFLADEFVECEEPFDLEGNETMRQQLGYGCLEFSKPVKYTKVLCSALDGIECYGSRTFARGQVPCVRYDGYYFPTVFLFSLFLGFFGVDRYYLGMTPTGVGKMLTLGGLGIWWLIDLILLAVGGLHPDTDWVPYY